MILAIDTATRFMSIALHDGQRVHLESTWHSANNHTIELTPAIAHALERTQIAVGDLTAIAVAQGPGSFTGLRIGMGVAKGLALSHDRPLVAIPTLDITAASVPVNATRLLAVLQAGRGRICSQFYRAQGTDWVSEGPATITNWPDTLRQLDHAVQIAGEIDDLGRQSLQEAGLDVQIMPAAFCLRRAGFLAELGWRRVRAGATDDPFHVTPIYLHQPGVPRP